MDVLSFGFALTLPEGWYRWDRADEVASSARDVDRFLADHLGLRPARSTLLRLLFDSWADAAADGALAAAVLWAPGPGAAVAARLFVLAAERQTPDDEPAEIARLLTTLRTDGPFDLRPRQCQPVDLPAGRAVRLRRWTRTGDAEPGDPEMEVDLVQHWLPVPGGETVILAGSTPCVALGDDLAEVFDSIADSFVVCMTT